MNKVLSAAVGLSFLFTACNFEEDAKPGITGHIVNTDLEWVYLYGGDDLLDSAKLDSTQTFQFNPELTEPGYYVLAAGDGFLATYLEPKSSLEFTAEGENFSSTASFTGKTAPAQAYLNEKKELRDSLGLLGREIYLLEPSQILEKLDQAEATMNTRLEKAVKASKDLNEGFKKVEMAEIDFMLATILLDYPRYHKYFAGKEDLELPEGFNARIENLDLNQAHMVENGAFQAFLRKRLNQKLDEAATLDSTITEADVVNIKMEAAEEMASAPEVREFITYEIIREQLMYYGPTDVEPYVQPFLETAKHEKRKTEIQELQTKWAALSPGSPAGKFVFENPEGEPVPLSKFSGKYVYIDVWATWCGPCKREIPSLEVLQEEFKGEDVVFLSVSVDDGRKEWKDFLTENELGGVQVYAPRAWQSDLATYYNIKAIPRFLLIDPEGKIVSATATRPSNPETKEQLEALLEKKG